MQEEKGIVGVEQAENKAGIYLTGIQLMNHAHEVFENALPGGYALDVHVVPYRRKAVYFISGNQSVRFPESLCNRKKLPLNRNQVQQTPEAGNSMGFCAARLTRHTASWP